MKNQIKKTGLLACAIFFFAASFNLFQAPHGLVTGGVTGIVLVLHGLFGVEIPLFALIINSMFLLLGLILLGKKFFMRTFLGSLVFYPIFLKIIPSFPVSNDMFLNCIVGGVLLGIGMAFLLVSNSSSGGTSLLARVLRLYVNIPFTIATALFDGVIIILGFFVFGFETGLYALILIAISTIVANYFESGILKAKQVLIFSIEQEKIIDDLSYKHNISLSKVPASGGYSKNEQNMILAIIPKSELKVVKEVCKKYDPKATVFVSEIHQAFGRKFIEL